MNHEVVDAVVTPEGRLDVLSRAEVGKLLDTSQGGLYRMFRNCSLAVLNCGSSMDDGKELLERYSSFSIRVVQEQRGIKLELKSAPAHAFVDGQMIKGIKEHLFCMLRFLRPAGRLQCGLLFDFHNLETARICVNRINTI